MMTMMMMQRLMCQQQQQQTQQHPQQPQQPAGASPVEEPAPRLFSFGQHHHLHHHHHHQHHFVSAKQPADSPPAEGASPAPSAAVARDDASAAAGAEERPASLPGDVRDAPADEEEEEDGDEPAAAPVDLTARQLQLPGAARLDSPCSSSLPSPSPQGPTPADDKLAPHYRRPDSVSSIGSLTNDVAATPAGAVAAAAHQRRLAFSVENILDPNKFTGRTAPAAANNNAPAAGCCWRPHVLVDSRSPDHVECGGGRRDRGTSQIDGGDVSTVVPSRAPLPLRKQSVSAALRSPELAAPHGTSVRRPTKAAPQICARTAAVHRPASSFPGLPQRPARRCCTSAIVART
ncbi:skin secretory protein xP2-like [Schistocerca americana]|uniref:skin secretory protein xP2-like n=1 Tax=Schistocerca americana TaxID=7009 RepID=UPI001F4FCD95|nr:skin secretory protein xP2-like [Schistocerca americana]